MLSPVPYILQFLLTNTKKKLNKFKIQHIRSLSLSPSHPLSHTHTHTNTHAHENATRILQRNNLEEMFLLLACKMQMQPQRHETFLIYTHTHAYTHTQAHAHKAHKQQSVYAISHSTFFSSSHANCKESLSII